MAEQEQFAKLCKSVCAARGWELLKSGVQVSWDDGRHQLVELEFFEHERRELVRLATTIGPADELSPMRLTVALRINAELAHGCLAVKGEDLVMTQTLLLERASEEEIDASIKFLAETADYYEKTIYHTDRH